MERIKVIPMDKDMAALLKMIVNQNGTIVDLTMLAVQRGMAGETVDKLLMTQTLVVAETNKILIEHLSTPMMLINPQKVGR
jgi:hypothetical protein